LQDLGLLELDSGDTVRLHRLLAVFIRAVAQNVSAQTAVEDVLLAAAEPLISVGYLGPVLALYPHLRAVTEAGQVRADIQTARLNMVLGRALHLLGDYAGAQPAYERSLALRERGLGPDHPDTAACLNNLAGLYYAQGRYAAAEPLYQRVLAIAEQVLGPDHPHTAAVRESYAILLRRRRGEAAPPPSLWQRFRTWLSGT
jgi:tetratricopeptide (TPR) repeat protein